MGGGVERGRGWVNGRRKGGEKKEGREGGGDEGNGRVWRRTLEGGKMVGKERRR